MSSQKEISWESRRQLVVYLNQIHAALSLTSESLFLTINYLDRFSSREQIPLRNYFLLGLVCLWIACKYEENFGKTPALKTLVQTQDSFNPMAFKLLEKLVLKVLNFDMGPPTPYTFLKTYLHDEYKGAIDQLYFLANYILELAALSPDYLSFKPSKLAKAAIDLANIIIQNQVQIKGFSFL